MGPFPFGKSQKHNISTNLWWCNQVWLHTPFFSWLRFFFSMVDSASYSSFWRWIHQSISIPLIKGDMFRNPLLLALKAMIKNGSLALTNIDKPWQTNSSHLAMFHQISYSHPIWYMIGHWLAIDSPLINGCTPKKKWIISHTFFVFLCPFLELVHNMSEISPKMSDEIKISIYSILQWFHLWTFLMDRSQRYYWHLLSSVINE